MVRSMSAGLTSQIIDFGVLSVLGGAGAASIGPTGDNSAAAQGEEIVVVADKFLRDRLPLITKYQYDRYDSMVDDDDLLHYRQAKADWALNLRDPGENAHGASYGAGSFFSGLGVPSPQLSFTNISFGGRDYGSVAAAQTAGMATIGRLPSVRSIYAAQRNQACFNSIGMLQRFFKASSLRLLHGNRRAKMQGYAVGHKARYLPVDTKI